MSEKEKEQLLLLLEKAWKNNLIEIGCGGENGSPTNIEYDKNGVLQIFST